jgi:hypothetical protein
MLRGPVTLCDPVLARPFYMHWPMTFRTTVNLYTWDGLGRSSATYLFNAASSESNWKRPKRQHHWIQKQQMSALTYLASLHPTLATALHSLYYTYNNCQF